MGTLKILIVTTSHGKMGDTGRRTGLWLEELATPYYAFKEAEASVTVASLNGGDIPLDPKSESLIIATRSTKNFQKDAQALALLSDSPSLDGINAADFDAVLLAGGHGAIWDFPDHPALKALLEDLVRQRKLIAALSHGASAFVSLQAADGSSFVKGRLLTAFSNKEEESSGLTATVPFLLESKLVALGASYSKAAIYTSHIVADGLLITGQNPASSGELVQKMLLCLKLSSERPAFAL